MHDAGERGSLETLAVMRSDEDTGSKHVFSVLDDDKKLALGCPQLTACLPRANVQT